MLNDKYSNIIIQAQSMQRKQELLTQLDNALKRKVQEKYLKSSKTQELQTLNHEFYGETEKNKVNSKIQHKNASNHNGTNFSRSPVATHKQQMNQVRSQNHINLKPPSNSVQSPKLMSQRQMSNHLNVQPNSIANSREEQITMGKAKEQIKKLRSKNIILQEELRGLKSNILQLQKESKLLKRDEGQYLQLRQQNNDLIKEISFLRKQNQNKKTKETTSEIDTNILHEEIKKVLLQLNINPLQRSVSESLQAISNGVGKLTEEKNKIASKLNNFDIETLLLKENNAAYRKQMEILRHQNEQLQALIQENCCKIEELEESVETENTEKKKLEGRLKDITKELDCLKRQFKMTIEASKSTRPKREQSSSRVIKQNFIEASVSAVSIVKTFTEQEAQTDDIVHSPLSHDEGNELKQQDYRKEMQEKTRQFNLIQDSLQKQILALNKALEELQSNILRMDIQKSKLEEKNYKYEEYIKDLEFKSEEIKKDLDNFMPQLKQIEEENNQLKHQNHFKSNLLAERECAIREMRMDINELEDKLATATLNLKKEAFERQLLQTELQKADSHIKTLTVRSGQLEKTLHAKENENNSIVLENANRQNQQYSKLSELQKLLEEKSYQMEAICTQWKKQQKELLAKIQKLQVADSSSEKLTAKLEAEKQELSNLKSSVQTKMNEFSVWIGSTHKKLQQYVYKQAQFERTFQKYQNETDSLLQSYTWLQRDSTSLKEQKSRQEQANQALALKIEELSKEMFAYKCDIQRLTFDNKNNLQLKEYYQQVSNELKSKLEQLLSQLTRAETEKSALIEKQLSIENEAQQSQIMQAKAQNSWELKNRQCQEVKTELRRMVEEYKLLSEQFSKFQHESSQQERNRLEQISLQNYDIQRLIRESNELKLRIDQLSTLRQSNLFKSNEVEQRLSEENRALAKQVEMLNEELKMRQASIQEDQYLNQLKNRQYCILLRKLLSSIAETEDFGNYQRFEDLLEVGAELALRRRSDIEQGGALRMETISSEFEMERLPQPAKRFYIGTQISSSQEIMGKNMETDEILQSRSNRNQVEIDSPRSFKLNLSPHEQKRQRKEKRTQRLMAYFNQSAESTSQPKQ